MVHTQAGRVFSPCFFCAFSVWTIRHSTRLLEERIVLLWENDVQHWMDVRTAPRSCHNP